MIRKLVFIFVVFLLGACNRTPETVLIGFAGELEGRYSSENIAARNGVQLAIDDLNANQRIAGKQLQLVVENDEGDATKAIQAGKALLDANVVAVVGHMASETTVAALPQMNKAQKVLFSPTVGQLAGQKDYLFRAAPSIPEEAKPLAVYLYQDLGIHNIVGVVDRNNAAYTKVLWFNLKDKFTALGGNVTDEFYFTSPNDTPRTVVEHYNLAALQTEAFVFLAADREIALLAQYCRQAQIKVPFFAPASAQTQDLLEKGGRAVEGLRLVAIYNPDNHNPAFQDFAQRFTMRFRRPPTMGAAYAYETMQVLAEGLVATQGRAEGLRTALLQVKNFPAIQGTLSIDEYGDTQRDLFIMQVQKGHFQLVKTMPAKSE